MMNDSAFQSISGKSLLVLLVLSLFPAGDIAAEEESAITAFVNVNVLPMNQEVVLENQSVLVENDRIMETGPADEIVVPAGALQVDGEGRYLMPGLAEMHGHIPGPDTPEYAEDVLFLYISNGVTLVRNMAGNAWHLDLRERVNRGEIPGPTIFAASPWMSAEQVPGPEEAEALVREYAETDFDLLKMGTISLEAYERMAEVAHEEGIPFAGHIPFEVGLERALELGQASIDHLDRYVEFLAGDAADREEPPIIIFGYDVVPYADEDRIEEAARLTREAGVWNVPTLTLMEKIYNPDLTVSEMREWPEMEFMPADTVNDWVGFVTELRQRDYYDPDQAREFLELLRKTLMALHDAGAAIALGSDAPQFFNVPGFSIHHEMQLMVDAGMTPYEVLVTGTRKPAEYFGTPDEFGTVQKDRRADLILLDANPLDDIANVQERAGVMIRGTWMPEEQIQEQLEEIASRRAAGM